MSDAVKRALQAADISVHYMSVYFGGLHIRMAEQILKDADIDPVFQQQIVVQVPRQYGGSVLSTLAASDEDEVLPEVYVLDAQTDAFHQPQPAAVKKLCHEGILVALGPLT